MIDNFDPHIQKMLTYTRNLSGSILWVNMLIIGYCNGRPSGVFIDTMAGY